MRTDGEAQGLSDDVIDRTFDQGEFQKMPGDDTVVCRCEEVTQGQIRRAVHDGMVTLTEIRRYLRAGMGLCQGQSCGKLVRRIVANELKMPQSAFSAEVSRAPMRPVEMDVLGNEYPDIPEEVRWA